MATAVEMKERNIKQMGQALGEHFSALWQEIVQAHAVWTEFVVLYGTKSSRVEILNRSASNFFYMAQQIIFEATMLHMARLTDPSTTGGRAKSNLTIKNLPELISDKELKSNVTELINVASKQSDFCRDWRNRHIAHRDLDLALRNTASPLEQATIAKTTTAIKAIADVLNAVESHYLQTAYDFASPPHGAMSLLSLLYRGLKANDQREERMKRGEFSEEDLDPEL
jgi:hypothetical protein